MIRLALLRHGHTAWNRAGRIQGRTDVPLDAAAREHLSGLQLPTPWDLANLVSSPLARAVQTAELISGRAPQTEAALTEMDWGEWEGQHGQDLLVQANSGYLNIEDWGWAYRPPGGESPQDVLDRLVPWVSSLKDDTVAVCHIGIMRMLLAKATGWNFDGPPPFRIKRDRLFVLAVEGNKWALEKDVIRLETKAS